MSDWAVKSVLYPVVLYTAGTWYLFIGFSFVWNSWFPIRQWHLC